MVICLQYEHGIADIWDHMPVLKSFQTEAKSDNTG